MCTKSMCLRQLLVCSQQRLNPAAPGQAEKMAEIYRRHTDLHPNLHSTAQAIPGKPSIAARLKVRGPALTTFCSTKWMWLPPLTEKTPFAGKGRHRTTLNELRPEMPPQFACYKHVSAHSPEPCWPARIYNCLTTRCKSSSSSCSKISKPNALTSLSMFGLLASTSPSMIFRPRS
jgi:hypothetical protein